MDKEIVNKQIEVLTDYVSTSKALNNYSAKQIGGLVAVGLLAGPLAPAIVGGLEVNTALEMKEKRDAHRKSIEQRINENVSLKDIDSLSASVAFLEEYASSLDSKLEIVSTNEDLFIMPIKR